MSNTYFFPTKDLNPKIPILKGKGDFPRYFIKQYRIENPELLHFRIGSPRPRKPVPGDFMFFPNLVVSDKIHAILSDIPDHTFQLLPCDLDFDGVILKDFWGLHIFQRYLCLDREKSSCEFEDLCIDEIEKLVFDEDLLSKIPLEQRLIFRMKEDGSRMLFHESIVEKFTQAGATGIRWVNLKDATTKTLF